MIRRVITAGGENEDKLCAICTCVPTPDEHHVLELCGHPICKPCFREQVLSDEVPIKCFTEVE